MIVQTMTPEEKCRQATLLELEVDSTLTSWIDNNQRLLKMRKTFPFTHTIVRNYKSFGKWNIILTFLEKPKFKKGFTLNTKHYQKFFVDRSSKAENIGAGIYLIGENAGISRKHIVFTELSPHFFHRLRQRYFERHGIVLTGFEDMVDYVNREIDRAMRVEGSKLLGLDAAHNSFLRSQDIPRCAGFENTALFTRDGIFLGISKPSIYYECYLTYIDREDLYSSQTDVHLLAEQYHDFCDKLLAYDPYVFIDVNSLRSREMGKTLNKMLCGTFKPTKNIQI